MPYSPFEKGGGTSNSVPDPDISARVTINNGAAALPAADPGSGFGCVAFVLSGL